MKKLNPLLKEIIILVVISTVLGISAQAVLPNGIRLITETTLLGSDSNTVVVPSVSINPEANSDAASNISLSEVYKLHQSGAALFFDARDPDDYLEGHIQNAINLPAHAFMDSLPYLESLDFDQFIITYCDGSDCNASLDLAADLKMMGFTRVSFFFGGWQEWLEAEYPIEASP
ncbi:hypothetical protein HQ531_14090 [bacterium]|nr:hypothetical protein [bacterium]